MTSVGVRALRQRASELLRLVEQGETVEIILDSLTLQDFNNFWGVSKASMQLSVGYIARMLHIQSSMPMSEYAEVQTREFGLGKV